MFGLSLHSRTGERELHHDHHLAAHSAEVPHIHPGPRYPYPGFSHVSLCLRDEEMRQDEHISDHWAKT